MKLFVLLIALSFAAKQSNTAAESDKNFKENVNEGEKYPIVVKIEEEECAKGKKKEKSSQYIGVSFHTKNGKWQTGRQSKLEKKTVHNGSYDNEEKAAHASDTLARKLMQNREQRNKLNFPDDGTEVFPEEKTTSSQYIGVSYDVEYEKWRAYRRSRLEKKMFSNGRYDNEETAAHASDTLARKLIANGDQGHKLNFPDDRTEVFPEEELNSSQYIGVTYDVNSSKWRAKRRSKFEKKMIYNGSYDNEETAAHASDTLARKLMNKGEQTHKLNFPDDETKVFSHSQRKRKRPHTLMHIKLIKDLNHHKNN